MPDLWYLFISPREEDFANYAEWDEFRKSKSGHLVLINGEDESHVKRKLISHILTCYNNSIVAHETGRDFDSPINNIQLINEFGWLNQAMAYKDAFIKAINKSSPEKVDHDTTYITYPKK